MENGQIDEWLASIDKGEKPTLTRFTAKPSTVQLALLSLALAWPALVVAGFSYFQRHRIAAKWRFGIAGLVVGYVALFVSGWGMHYVVPMVLSALANYPLLVMPALYGSTVASFVISLLAVVGTYRFFVAEDKAS